MCAPLIAVGLTVATTAASMAATASSQSAARKQAQKVADDQNAAAAATAETEYKNQEATMRWQDDTWQQDLDFANQTLGYQAAEFAKQQDYVQTAGTALVKNENASMAQALLKQVQQNIATTLSEVNVNRDAARARATAQVQADARGVQGSSVEAIVDDVSRQQGQAVSVMEMNRSAMNQQARLDLEAVKAEGDTQLGQLAASVKTYSPSTPIHTPQPVGAVQAPTVYTPAERSSLGDTLAIVGAGVSGAMTGFNAFNSLSGSTPNQTISGVGKYLGIG